jgi:hypothetical protein
MVGSLNFDMGKNTEKTLIGMHDHGIIQWSIILDPPAHELSFQCHTLQSSLLSCTFFGSHMLLPKVTAIFPLIACICIPISTNASCLWMISPLVALCVHIGMNSCPYWDEILAGQTGGNHSQAD